MYQISSAINFKNILMSDSWIFNDNITNVGMMICDNKRIGSNKSTYTTKVLYENGEINTATISQRNTFTYGTTYTYRQYEIKYKKTEYVMYQVKTADTTSFKNILMTDSWIFNDTITNVGMLLCDNERINANDTTSYTAKVVDTSGSVYAASISQINTFTYGDNYRYRQYSISANSKTEFVMYQIKTVDTTITVKNILMSDARIFNDNITNVGMMICDNRRIGSNNTAYTTKVLYEDGVVYAATVSQIDTYVHINYTYRHYSITANGKTEYAMYRVLTKTPTSFINMLMSDSWIYVSSIISGDVYTIICDYRRLGTGDNTHISKVVNSNTGEIYDPTISNYNNYTYGDYTYKQYKIIANDITFYAMYKIKSASITSVTNISSFIDSFMFVSKITNVGLLICNYETIGSNTNYRSIIATTDGTIYTALISQRNTFVHGDYTYRQYSISADFEGSSTEYAMFRIKTDNTASILNVLMSDSWIFNDTITNVGMLLCDSKNINVYDVPNSNTSKVATTSGIIYIATLKLIKKFIYGNYTYREYSITANSKTEYVMYQIKTANTNLITNIVMCNSPLITKDISEYVLIYNSSRYTDLNIMKWYTGTSILATIYSDGSYTLDAPSGTEKGMFYDTVVRIGIIYGDNHTLIFKNFAGGDPIDSRPITHIILDGKYYAHFIGTRGFALDAPGIHIPMIKDYRVDKTYKDLDLSPNNSQSKSWLITSDVKLFNIDNLEDENGDRYSLYEEQYHSKSVIHTLTSTGDTCIHGDYHTLMRISLSNTGGTLFGYRHHIGCYKSNSSCTESTNWSCTGQLGLVGGYYTINKTTT